MSIADISLFSALLAGALSFLSPCVLPLVPPYLCYMAGVSVEQFRTEDTAPRRRFAGQCCFRPSSSRSVSPRSSWRWGQAPRRSARFCVRDLDILAKIGGFIIILMGLNFLGVFRIGLFSREARFQGRASLPRCRGLMSWVLPSPSAGRPALARFWGYFVAAARDTVGDGAALLAVYSLGLAVPFWIAAAFSGSFMRFLVRFRRHLGLVEKLLGVLLVLTGLAFMSGFITNVAIWFQETFPILMQIG